jgi:hypothetical protein
MADINKKTEKLADEIAIAIAMALYEATELHDEEHPVLTIKRESQAYSPWSAKANMFRQTPILNKK